MPLKRSNSTHIQDQKTYRGSYGISRKDFPFLQHLVSYPSPIDGKSYQEEEFISSPKLFFRKNKPEKR